MEQKWCLNLAIIVPIPIQKFKRLQFIPPFPFSSTTIYNFWLKNWTIVSQILSLTGTNAYPWCGEKISFCVLHKNTPFSAKITIKVCVFYTKNYLKKIQTNCIRFSIDCSLTLMSRRHRVCIPLSLLAQGGHTDILMYTCMNIGFKNTHKLLAFSKKTPLKQGLHAVSHQICPPGF